MPWFPFSGPVKIAANLAAAAVLLASAGAGDSQPFSPGELRDIAPPVEMPEDPQWPIYAAAALCVAVIAGAAGYMLRRRRSAQRAAEAAAALRSRPPHEVAREGLRELELIMPQTLAAQREYHIRIVEILRAYIAGRFGIEAPDATSSELLSCLRRTRQIAENHQQLLRTVFSQSDLVKFAAFLPAQDAARSIWQSCWAFVQETAEEETHAL